LRSKTAHFSGRKGNNEGNKFLALAGVSISSPIGRATERDPCGRLVLLGVTGQIGMLVTLAKVYPPWSRADERRNQSRALANIVTECISEVPLGASVKEHAPSEPLIIREGVLDEPRIP
jgi:hypothetical protein